jgi:hypothetical protein
MWVNVPDKKTDRAEDKSTNHHLHSWIDHLFRLFIECLANRLILKQPQEELCRTNDIDYERDWR